jgi:hypothetical protein
VAKAVRDQLARQELGVLEDGVREVEILEHAPDASKEFRLRRQLEPEPRGPLLQPW